VTTLIVTKAPVPEGFFDPQEFQEAQFYFRLYSTVMKCKTLGIPAPKLDARALDYVYEIYNVIHDLHIPKVGKNGSK
jgi:hypothetical protein